MLYEVVEFVCCPGLPTGEICGSCCCDGDLDILDIDLEWCCLVLLGAMYAGILVLSTNQLCCKGTPCTFPFRLWISDSPSMLKLKLNQINHGTSSSGSLLRVERQKKHILGQRSFMAKIVCISCPKYLTLGF